MSFQIDGIGEQALAISIDELAALLKLPDGTEIVDIEAEMLRPCVPNWHYEPRQAKRLFVRIKHKYAFRGYPGAPLSHEPLDKFVKRVKDLTDG